MAKKITYRVVGSVGRSLDGQRVKFRYLADNQKVLKRLYKEGVSGIEQVELDVKPKAKKISKNEEKESNNIKSEETTEGESTEGESQE